MFIKNYPCEAPLRIYDKTVSIILTSNKTSLAKYKTINYNTKNISDIDQVHQKITSKTEHINLE
jgi:hypothetical protein